MKKCGKCKEEKEFNLFSKSKYTKDGYYNTCKSCKKKYREDNKDILSEKRKIYDEANKEKIKEYQKVNKEKIKEYLREYRIKNKDKIKIKSKENYNKNIDYHREVNKEYQIKNREKRNKREKDRRDNDPIYKLNIRIRSLISNSLVRNGYSKKSKTEEILGCSFEEFRLYLESKFEDWMTWKNRGLYNGELNYGWDIDHIIPSSSSIDEDVIIKLNHFSNLQPLCSKVNRDIKRDSC